MKKLIVTLAALVVATGAFAQLKFGVKAGGNISTISGVADYLGVLDHDYGVATKSETTQSMKLGFNVGAWAEYMVMPMFGVQVELYYSLQGVNANNTWSTDSLLGSASTNTDYVWSANYINIPILAKVHFANIAAYVGPQLGFAMGMTQKTTSTNSLEPDNADIKKSTLEDYSGFDLSLALGAQYKLTANIGIDARYNIGLTNVFPTLKNDEGEVTREGFGKQGVIQLGVFYEF